MRVIPAIFRRRNLALLALLGISAPLFAAEGAVAATAAGVPAVDQASAIDPLRSIQLRWAEIRYATPEKQQVEAYQALLEQLEQERRLHPQDLRLQVWEGIVLASQAGAKGGLGALSLVKRAKSDFEAVIAKDGALLDGSAYTSLGSLYYQVPGWPIGFGDDDKAAVLLRKGLEIAPGGIDANYFYGDFLRDQGEYAQAREYLQRALAAADRPGRELADRGRREEARAALAEVEHKLR
jgi:tetratricopeptide (TPR) repeat protein